MTYDPAQGDGAQLMDIMQLQAALNGFSLVDSTEATVTPGSSNLTVDVAGAPAGVRLGGPAEAFGGATGVALPSPDANNPRKALVYLDSAGGVQALGGAPAAAKPSGEIRTATGVPTVPIPTESFLPLAEVWIAAGTPDISQGDIVSRKISQFASWDYNKLANTPTVSTKDVKTTRPVGYNEQVTDTVSESLAINGGEFYTRTYNFSGSLQEFAVDGAKLDILINASRDFSFHSNMSIEYTAEIKDDGGDVVNSISNSGVGASNSGSNYIATDSQNFSLSYGATHADVELVVSYENTAGGVYQIDINGLELSLSPQYVDFIGHIHGGQ